MRIDAFFQGHAFDKDLEKGKSSGDITLSDAGIAFHCAQKKIHMPLNGLTVKMGGAANRLVFFDSPHHPSSSIYTHDRSILKHPALAHYQSTQKDLVTINRRRYLGMAFIIAAVVIALLSPLIAYQSIGHLSHAIAKQIPLKWEQKIAQSAFAQYQLHHDILDSDTTQNVLTPLTSTLTDALHDSPYDFQFYISKDSTVNAFAMPGGTIVIHSGLILQAESAEELLGVLAHEISHVNEKHTLRNIISSLGTYSLFSVVFGDVSGILAVLIDASPLLLTQRYSRDFETDADLKGHALLLNAQVNPTGLTAFFQRLIERQEAREKKAADKKSDADEGADNTDYDDAVDALSGLLRTHPATQERINAIKALPTAESRQPYLDLSNAFLSLQAQVKAFSLSTPSTSKDDSL